MGNYHARFYEGLGRGNAPSLLSTTNNSQFTYDPVSQFCKIVEITGGSITSTKQLIWGSQKMLESRDATGAVTARYAPLGEIPAGANLFFDIDQVGSVRSTSNNAGSVQSQSVFDLYGRIVNHPIAPLADFQYCGYYFHAPSGLNFSIHRAYLPSLGRWINRDPIGEMVGPNLFQYVLNAPVALTDPLGYFPPGVNSLWPGTKFCGSNCSSGNCGNHDGIGYGEGSPNMPIGPGSSGWTEPISPLDWCCYIHDLCTHWAHTIPDPNRRKCLRKECHQDLAKCALKSGSLSMPVFVGLFGRLGITGTGAGSAIDDPRMPPPSGTSTSGDPPPLRGL